MRRMLFKFRFLGLIAIAAVAGAWPMAAQAAVPGSAASFAVLAGIAATCTTSTVTGLVGVNFTTAAGCTGAQYAPDAYRDFRTTYTGVAANLGPCTRTFGIADTLDGLSLAPGVYCFPSYAALTGTLHLTGAGPWWFEIGTLGTGYLEASNFTVLGGNPCSAYWWVRQYATLTTSTFQGTILGGTAITLTGTAVAGRVWATGSVTMTNSTVGGGCSGAVAVPGPACENENADGGQTGQHTGQNADGDNESCNSEDSHQDGADHKVSDAARVETSTPEIKSTRTHKSTVTTAVKAPVKSKPAGDNNSQSGNN